LKNGQKKYFNQLFAAFFSFLIKALSLPFKKSVTIFPPIIKNQSKSKKNLPTERHKKNYNNQILQVPI